MSGPCNAFKLLPTLVITLNTSEAGWDRMVSLVLTIWERACDGSKFLDNIINQMIPAFDVSFSSSRAQCTDVSNSKAPKICFRWYISKQIRGRVKDIYRRFYFIDYANVFLKIVSNPLSSKGGRQYAIWTFPIFFNGFLKCSHIGSCSHNTQSHIGRESSQSKILQLITIFRGVGPTKVLQLLEGGKSKGSFSDSTETFVLIFWIWTKKSWEGVPQNN